MPSPSPRSAQPSWNTIGYQSGRDLSIGAPLGGGRGSVAAQLAFHGGAGGSSHGSRALHGHGSDDRRGGSGQRDPPLGLLSLRSCSRPADADRAEHRLSCRCLRAGWRLRRRGAR